MVPCGRASSLTTVRRANVTKYTPRNHDMNWLNGKCLLRLVGFDTETTSGVICSMRRVEMNESASICRSYTLVVFGSGFISASDPIS